MAIYKNNQNISPIKYQDRNISKVYKGEDLVYSSIGDDSYIGIIIRKFLSQSYTLNVHVRALRGETVIVNWGDGQTSSYTAASSAYEQAISHEYPVIGGTLDGPYNVTVRGKFTKIRFSGMSANFSISEIIDISGYLITDVTALFYNNGSYPVAIDSTFFRKCPNITNFTAAFARDIGDLAPWTGITPRDTGGIRLWERAGKSGYPANITGTDCFLNCTNLDDYSDIPSDWK